MKAKVSEKRSGPYITRYDTTIILTAVFFLLIHFIITPVYSQSSPLHFTVIPATAPDIVAPGRGAEQWHNENGAINYPSEEDRQLSLDVYYRFTWNRLEGATQGSYTWEYFDDLVREAIDKGQKLSFGIMSCYPYGNGAPGVVTYDNGNAAYPEYLHRLMQTEPIKDWKTTGNFPTGDFGSWVPNWNSSYYLDRLKALHEALYTHIKSSFYIAVAGPHKGKTIAFKDAISSIDIRGYGSWGEWHSAGIIDVMTSYPAGTRPTAATLKTIIDHHVKIFTDHPLSIMMSAFDAERLPNTFTPKEVTAYALQQSNNWGRLGWRRDNWGAIDDYIDRYLKDNTESFGINGPFNAEIIERWKYAPITGEPPNWVASRTGSCGYDDLERQVREYHATSVGNGNYGSYDLPDCAKENIRAAFKAAGYRIIPEGGSISDSIKIGHNFEITLNWKNIGIAPAYEKWDVVFELKDSSNAIVWSDSSKFTPGYTKSGLFLPSSAATIVKDNFVLPAAVKAGKYNLDLKIKDPSGYRAPLPLAITGRNEDGSYTLKNVIVDTSGITPPVVTPPTDTIPVTDTIPPVDSIPPTIPGSDDCLSTTATISNTPDCNGEGFDLILASAEGTGPFDININGIIYNDIPVGGTITRINGTEKIWSTNPAPRTYEDRPVELGVKFTSSQTGYIKGIRFFSANNVGGEYNGHLWDEAGNLLATVSFSNVTANGWQEALFSEPVKIVAGAIYTASYYNPIGIYTATSGGLIDSVFNGHSLTILSNDTKGGNGVYTYEGNVFPTHTFNATNYWVDVIFSRDTSHTFNLTAVSDSSGCTNTKLVQTLVVTPSSCVSSRPGTINQTAARSTTANATIQQAVNFSNELQQNYPNPFRSETIIRYSLAKASKVNLSLFDINGRLVKVLVNGSKEAGAHSITVTAGSLTAGIYLYRIQTGNFTATKRLVIQ